jgi:hypothetical protein
MSLLVTLQNTSSRKYRTLGENLTNETVYVIDIL